jgi:hypothetical protein
VDFTRKGVFWMSVLVLVLTAVAGVAPLLPSSVDSRGAAIAMGLGAQTIFKGVLAAGKEAVRPPDPPGNP